MRLSKVILVAMAASAVLAGLWLVYVWHYPPSSAPKASISLLGYTSLTLSAPDPKAYTVFLDPGRGEWTRAQMRLTNEGSGSISYRAYGDEPYGWVNAQTDRGKTNGYLAPHLTGGTKVLGPGSSATFSVVLPTNTLQWQCGFDVETASVRERAIWKVLGSPSGRGLAPLCVYLIRMLPEKTGPRIEVKSGSLEITNAALRP